MAPRKPAEESKGTYADRFPGGKPLHGGDGKLNHQWSKVGQELVGTFLGMKPYKNGFIARLREAEGDTVKAFSVPDVLQGMLDGVSPGTDLAIIFSGTKQSTKGNDIKLFEVYEM